MTEGLRMKVNLDEIKARYNNLSDEDIESIAKYKADGLIPEALDILKNEIQKRGLPEQLISTADILANGISEDEHLVLAKKISQLPCPHCNKNNTYLNAFNLMIVKSFIIFTITERPLVIGCPDCISGEAKSALIKSLLLGWWGLPFGPIQVLISIFKNIRAVNAGMTTEPTKEFRDFIKPHAAAIMARQENIKDFNSLFNIT